MNKTYTCEESRDRMLTVCNTLSANAGFLAGKGDYKSASLLLDTEKSILAGLIEKEEEERSIMNNINKNANYLTADNIVDMACNTLNAQAGVLRRMGEIKLADLFSEAEDLILEGQALLNKEEA